MPILGHSVLQFFCFRRPVPITDITPTHVMAINAIRPSLAEQAVSAKAYL